MDVYSKARDLGIELEFQDGQGHRHAVSEGRLRAILDGLPPRARHPYLKQPIVVAHAGDFGIPINASANGFGWRLTGLNGDELAQGCVADATIDLPRSTPIGVYRLELEDNGVTLDSIPLLVTSPMAWQGSFDRVWVMSVQLYGLRSARNWGIGDFSDLAALIALMADWGCAGIGLNPLHALFDDQPLACSPYAPNSRLFLNPLYIDPERLPQFPNEWLAQHRDRFDHARHGELIDYAAVADLKFAALRHGFSIFKTRAAISRAEFEHFRRQGGELLRRFSCFEALRKKFAPLPWWQWPEEWRRPDDARIQECRRGPLQDEIEFVEFVQWCASSQLQSCADLAAERGMAVGLYLDVAVGVQAGGFDAWNEQVAISRALSVGAPPDLLNTAGQDWGLAGFNAGGLEARGFAPFREMVRASMRFAGAIRLDHVLGLNRLYLIPSGSSPRDGVYVEMPLEALLGVIALESVNQRCITIGEDLGTVPDGFRERLAAWGVWSYKVMMFERGHDGALAGSSAYAANALVTFNTHDLASFAGWQSNHDLAVKWGLAIDPGETDEQRAQAHRAFEWKLGEEHIERKDFYGAVAFLARSPSRILAIAIDDLLGLKDQPNIPGTVDEHPNWRRRLPVELGDLARHIDREALQYALRGR